MDKNEYKIKADEIKALIAQAEYQQAAEIADSIDWRRVKSVMMLCTISDLYKINRRYEDSRDILLLAYDRHPGGRTIVYSLCELSIKIEDYVMAIEYYKEFVQIAPKDTGRYILQYKLYQAQDVSLEERIAVLEELKAKDYREKWAYELAYLYHRVGLATKCIEECDELILWFGEGKYVVKAMELKMLHQPLTPEQQGKYDSRFQPEPYYEDSESFYQEQEPVYEGGQGREYYSEAAYAAEQSVSQEEKAAPPVNVLTAPTIRIPSDEVEIQVKTMDVGEYNTINLQRELAEGLREVLEDEESQDAITRSIIAPMMEDDAGGQDVLPDDTAQEDGYAGEAAEEQMETEVFFGATGEIGSMSQTEVSVTPQEILAEEEVYTEELPTEIAEAQPEEIPSEEELLAEEPPVEEEIAAPPEDQTAAIVMEQLRLQNMGIEPPKEMAGVLSMESDGQISLVVPETEEVEKQITGQMRIEDILAEWERRKRDNEEKRKEEIHQKVLRQTGPMFTAFEESIRDGLLEQLEQGVEPEQIVQEAEDVPEEEELLSEEETAADEDTVEELEEIEEIEEEPAEELPEDEPTEEIYEEETAEEEPAEEYTEEESAEEEPVEEETAEEESAEEEPAGEYTEEESAEEEPAGEYTEEETIEEETVEEYTEEETTEEEPVEEETAGEYTEEEPAEETPAEEEPQEEETNREPVQESVEETPDSREPQEHEEKPRVRTLSKEEKELFGPFIQSKSSREQLIAAIDTISLASYTGNVIITGDEGMDTLTLAKNMIREVQMTDSNFSGKIAKISGSSLNRRDIAQTLDSLANGALIIQKASDMSMNTVETLYKALQQEQYGLIVIMEDTRKAMNKFLGVYTKLAECFNARMDMEALSNDSLVAFGKKYAREREYSIDELGILALHTRIAEMQTSDHAVTIMDVKEILDEAILHADRKSMGHFFDILLAKRYDEEDMIILRENDFIK